MQESARNQSVDYPNYQFLKVNPTNGNIESSFTIEGIQTNHWAFDYDEVNDRLIHIFDNDVAGFSQDTIFETDTNGTITRSGIDLFNDGDDSEDIHGLAYDSNSERLWTTEFRTTSIHEIDRDGNKITSYSINFGNAPGIGFNPATGNLYYVDPATSILHEMTTSGSVTEFNMTVGNSNWWGIDFTPTGDLVISTYNGTNTLYFFDSNLDTDNLFTTQAIPEPSNLIIFLITIAITWVICNRSKK